MNNTVVIKVGGKVAKAHAEFIAEYISGDIAELPKRWYHRHQKYEVRAQNVVAPVLEVVTMYVQSTRLPLKLEVF